VKGDRGKQLVALLCLTVALVGPPSGIGTASEASIRDQNDTRGRLDLIEVAHSHNRESEAVTHTIRTHDRWRSRLLHTEATEIDYWFSTDDDPAPEKVIYVTYRSGSLRAKLYRYQASPDGADVTLIRNLTARHPRLRRLEVRVPKRYLRTGEGSAYRWWSTTYFYDPEHSVCDQQYFCSDRAPDKGGISHRI
jgi:hypothetical protein